MKSRAGKYFLILLAVIFWGSSFIAVKIALRELAPTTIVLFRLIIAVIFLASISFYTKQDFSLNIKNHGSIFFLALISVFHLWIQVKALEFTTASASGWIVGTAPIFIALLGAIFFKEKLTIFKVTGILLAMLGLMLLITNGNLLSINLIKNKGDLMMLSSAFIWGVYSIANKKIALSYPPLMMIFYLFLMMAIMITPFTINGAALESIQNLSLNGWAAVLFLGLLCSGAAYVIWASALRDMDSAKVGAFLYLEPLFTVFAAWAILNEQITLLMLLSGMIILLGIYLVNRG
ncbi:putative amino-acid metabolite efflux pump [bacterium BMS3Abin03]|nr:putative amino-acid metabolite efflux pump [bacterium BMS3Abin03]